MAATAPAQQFCLRWSNHESNLTNHFDALRKETMYVDVTLACEGRQLKAHKMVLSACSLYFHSLFQDNPGKNTIIILNGVKFCDLKALIEFIYKGQVSIKEDQLQSFLNMADNLKIKGLAEVNKGGRFAVSGGTQLLTQNNPPNAIRNEAVKKSAAFESRSSPQPKKKRKAEIGLEDESPTSILKDALSSKLEVGEESANHSTMQGDSEEIPNDENDDNEIEPKSECIELSDDNEDCDEGGDMEDSFGMPYDASNEDLAGTSSGLIGLDMSGMPGQASPPYMYMGLKKYKCSKCSKTYTDTQMASAHYRMTHLPTLYRVMHKCQFCPAQFTHKGNLLKHIHKIHDVWVKTQFSRDLCCPVCPYKTEVATKFVVHVEVMHLGMGSDTVYDASASESSHLMI